MGVVFFFGYCYHETYHVGFMNTICPASFILSFSKVKPHHGKNKVYLLRRKKRKFKDDLVIYSFW